MLIGSKCFLLNVVLIFWRHFVGVLDVCPLCANMGMLAILFDLPLADGPNGLQRPRVI